MRDRLSVLYNRLARRMGLRPSAVDSLKRLERYDQDGWKISTYRPGQTVKLELDTVIWRDGPATDEAKRRRLDFLRTTSTCRLKIRV